jgi:hypothetical protein
MPLSLMYPMLHLLSMDVLTLLYSSYLDKNSRWVIDGANSDYYSYFPEDYKTCSQPVNVPMIGATMRVLYFTSATFV